MIFNVVVGVVASQKWTIEWQDIGARCSQIHRYPKQPLCNWVKIFLKFHFETSHLILFEVFGISKYLLISNQNVKNPIWYFVSKIVLTYCEKNCSSDREKL